MSQLVVINLGFGTLAEGCEYVTAELLSSSDKRPSRRSVGSLPAAPDLAALYRNYRLFYTAYYGWQPDATREITIEKGGLTRFSKVEFDEVCQQLEQQMNAWLHSDPFQPIYQTLCQQLQPTEEIQLILETDDPQLRQLPWQLWNFFDHYPKAELALSTQEYGRNDTQLQTPKGKVRILAIVGNSEGLDLDADRQAIEALPGAEVVFLDAPTRRHLNEQLWDRKGWDILFFAGHTRTDEGTGAGEVSINETDHLSLSQLKHALTEAINRGLTLAIFNSCSGLGLARELADLDIPQVMVMREIVPDAVAQAFFKYFLEAFANEEDPRSLYLAVRQARTRLEGLEDQYPCATWLPVICQHPATAQRTWQQLRGYSPLRHLFRANLPLPLQMISGLGITLVSTLLLMGVRHFGLIQSWELITYDWLMQQRPVERPDDRILIVTVTEDDLKYRPAHGSGANSLPDSQLVKLLDELETHQPRSIGMDIFRPHDGKSMSPNLARHLQRKNFFGICQVEAPNEASHLEISPPAQISADRQGFSDIVLDPDNVLRRALLVMGPRTASKCQTQYALSAQLAFHYLEQEGIAIDYTKHNELKLGSAIIKRVPSPKEKHPLHELFHSRQGGYQNVDKWGYQTLLNYRTPRSLSQGSFEHVDLQQVLQGQLDSKKIKNRIILIGVSAKSFGDLHQTPLNTGQPQLNHAPGVVIQAEVTSQLISTALDGRPSLSVWPVWAEVVWVWAGSLVSGILFWVLGSRVLNILGIGLVLGVGLYYICLMLLIQGLWVPLIPSALAMGVMGLSVIFLQRLAAKRSGHLR